MSRDTHTHTPPTPCTRTDMHARMQVDRRGAYTSPMPNSARRFAATLGELTGGRVGLTAASVSLLRSALTVAIRYSLQRQQFGPPEQPEIAILDYQSQQERLMPLLAAAYGLGFAKEYLVDQYVAMKRSRDEKLVADVHSLSAGLKACVHAPSASTLPPPAPASAPGSIADGEYDTRPGL